MRAAMLRLVAPNFIHVLVKHSFIENGEIRISGE